MIENRHYELIAKYLLDKTILNQKTIDNESDLLYDISPDKKFYIGRLSPINKEISSKSFVTNAIGVEFSVLSLQKVLEISTRINGDLYYRVIPTYDEQIESFMNDIKKETGKDYEDISDVIYKLVYIDLIAKLHETKDEQSPQIRSKYVDLIGLINAKLECSYALENFDEVSIKSNLMEELKEFVNHILNLEELITNSVSFVFRRRSIPFRKIYKRIELGKLCDKDFILNDFKNIDEEIERYNIYLNKCLIKYYSQCNEFFTGKMKSVKVMHMISKQKYEDYTTKERTTMSTLWCPELKIKHNILESGYLFIQLCNSISSDISDFDIQKLPFSLNIFNVKLNVSIKYSGNDVPLKKNILRNIKGSYKYAKVFNYSYGYNCSVIESKLNNTFSIKTETAPVYSQRRRVDIQRENLDTSFETLSSNWVTVQKVLNEILKEMKNELEIYKNDIEKSGQHLSNRDKQDFENDIKNFEFEIKRFEFGYKCMDRYKHARDAFKYLNEAFYIESLNLPYSSWRLFQIVFIVSNIPDIISSEYSRDALNGIESNILDKNGIVDILYYPTGGGKTEAFFGCVIYTLFFDRLRGKSEGTSAIIKYPLRLLSIQQVERLSIKIAYAQKIKTKYQISGDSFSYGYFVGGGNTPNSYDKDFFKNKTKIISYIEDYKLIKECPMCGNEVETFVDQQKKRFIHKCTKEDCFYSNDLLFRIVDEDIYRYPPSVIISTLDKYAVAAFNDSFKNLFGLGERKCYQHGLDSKYCNNTCTLLTPVYKDPVPTLVISDEVHLIKESLGTFSGHYEGFIDYYTSSMIKDASINDFSKQIKYIGATATISNYVEQVHQLYLKKARLFPCASPNINRSFYSEFATNDITRYILGLMPLSVSPVNFSVYLIRDYRLLLMDYLKKPNILKDLFLNELSTEEITKILYSFYIIIQYNNTKRESSRIRQGIDFEANNHFSNDDSYKLNTNTLMTGDSEFTDVKNILKNISDENDPRKINENYITATSMISHGVDSKKFNYILFQGLPNTTAEYIQAYSRVGRTFSGIVINILRPMRAREESMYSNFKEFHQYQDVLVSPVPIRRLTLGSLEKSFSGIILSIIRQYYRVIFNDKRGLNKDFDFIRLLNKINKDELIGILIKVYGLDIIPDEIFKLKLIEYVDRLYNGVTNSSPSGKRVFSFIESITQTSYPMRSLRDTDKSVRLSIYGGKNHE